MWAVKAAHGFGPLLSQPGKFTTLAEFLPVFVPSLTAMIGFWATLSLNMPDFTRFGRSQREQVVGQAVALPTTMFVFAAMGVLITSASAIIYGEPIWDPVKLVGSFTNPLVVGIAMFSVVVATLAVNIAANVVSPANDFANALPRWISLQDRRAHHRAHRHRDAAVAAARRPHGLHLHVAGRLLGRPRLDRGRADRRLLDRAAPAARTSRTSTCRTASYGGWSMPRGGRDAGGCALAWGGLVVPVLRPLYDYAWFVGFLVAGGVYVALKRGAARRSKRARRDGRGAPIAGWARDAVHCRRAQAGIPRVNPPGGSGVATPDLGIRRRSTGRSTLNFFGT